MDGDTPKAVKALERMSELWFSNTFDGREVKGNQEEAEMGGNGGGARDQAALWTGGLSWGPPSSTVCLIQGHCEWGNCRRRCSKCLRTQEPGGSLRT